MPQKKILYVIGSLDLGGAEKQLVQVMVRLKQRGWEPMLWVLGTGGPLGAFLDQHNISYYGVLSSRFFTLLLGKIKNKPYRLVIRALFSFFGLLKLLWRQKPDVIHYFLPLSYLIGGPASLLSPTKKRIMSRRSLNHYQRTHKFWGMMERFLHRFLTMACANSKAVEEELRAENIPGEKIRLIYNGIDPTPYEGELDRFRARQEENIPPNALVFIMVANLIPYKGHLDLIEALSKIQDKLPDSWLLLCVGRDDGIGELLRKASREKGLEGKVRFLGSRADVPSLLKISDIGILCSHQEGFSNAILEGMAAGLPMIVTDVGGNREAVIHGETGYVVPSHDPNNLSQAIGELAIDSTLATKFGQAGKKRVLENFTFDVCIKNYECLYEEVLKND